MTVELPASASQADRDLQNAVIWICEEIGRCIEPAYGYVQTRTVREVLYDGLKQYYGEKMGLKILSVIKGVTDNNHGDNGSLNLFTECNLFIDTTR